jgi:site-specific recombinase XerD
MQLQSGLQTLTANQVASILQIHEHTVNTLVHTGILPYNSGQPLRFSKEALTGWLRKGPVLMIDEEARLEELKKYYENEFPEAIKALKEFDKHHSVRKPKLYSLSKVENKRNGFLYYVRYLENGKLIPSRWCTHTNDRESAERFARENRERLIREHHDKKNNNMYVILGNYYKENSSYLETAEHRGRKLSTSTRRRYHNFITRIIIPFLREKKIRRFEEITAPDITELQDRLLKKGNKAHTINRFLGCLKTITDHLVSHGKITENVFDKVVMLKKRKQDYKVRGCHEIHAVKGVFAREWEDKVSYLLCLIIYTTGMRNSEIEKMRVKDLIKLNGYNFINIPESKTENGVRIVPVHDFVHKKLSAYIIQTGKHGEDYIFSKNGNPLQSTVYRKANEDMLKALKLETGDTKDISFYSGRHFWKTLMSAEDLGSVEEYFMGHKVSRDVAKRYNHLDKQGQKKILGKAKEVYKILDRYIFN